MFYIGRTETSVVLKYELDNLPFEIPECRTETSVVLKYIKMPVIRQKTDRRTETSVVLKFLVIMRKCLTV